MARWGMAAALLLVAQAALANGHGASAPPPPKQEALPAPARLAVTKGRARLVDPRGMTLYYFDRDDTGKTSSCEGKCTEKWIPFAAPADARATGDFTVITRSDGTKMWAYRYRPLYTSKADNAPGDENGFDPSNLWHVVRPY